jgi:hypothetical protein
MNIDQKLIGSAATSEAGTGLEEGEGNGAHDLQVGHRTATAEQHYGVDVNMLHQLTQESMSAMQAVLERWHAFWAMHSRFREKTVPFRQLSAPVGLPKHASALRDVKRQLESPERYIRH